MLVLQFIFGSFSKGIFYFSIFSDTKFPPSLVIQFCYMCVAFNKGHVYFTKDLCCLKNSLLQFDSNMYRLRLLLIFINFHSKYTK